MHKDKKKPGSFPSKKLPVPLKNDLEGASRVFGGDPGSGPQKKDSPNLFEEHIRKLKKESDC